MKYFKPNPSTKLLESRRKELYVEFYDPNKSYPVRAYLPRKLMKNPNAENIEEIELPWWILDKKSIFSYFRRSI